MRDFMNPVVQCSHTKEDGETVTYEIVQPFIKDIKEFEKCLLPLPDSGKKNYPELTFPKVFSKKNEGQIVFLMYNYVESLFKVFKKNICPWATFKQVE